MITLIKFKFKQKKIKVCIVTRCMYLLYICNENQTENKNGRE